MKPIPLTPTARSNGAAVDKAVRELAKDGDLGKEVELDAVKAGGAGVHKVPLYRVFPEESREGLARVFGDKPPLISSTKSLTGHSLGAAGAQEAIYCLLMMNNGFAAESANIENLDPAFEGLPILRQRADRELSTVMSNSFGFGGTNATLVMSRI